MRNRRDESNSSTTPLLLILGLALGIPAVIGLLILAVVFGLGFFAMRAGRALKEDLEAVQQRAAAQHAANMARQNAFDPRVGGEQPMNVPAPKPPPGVPGKTMIDLIPLIDPLQDKVNGDRWEVINKELHCKEAIFVARIEIPYQPPAEYDFIVTFSQPGLRNGISLIMPKPGGGSFFWYLGSNNGSTYGFASTPNREGQLPGLIQPNTAHTTTVQVRRTGVKGLADGKELIHHPTNFGDLTCDNWREIRDKRLLAVACDDPTLFHHVRLVEISGPGQRTR